MPREPAFAPSARARNDARARCAAALRCAAGGTACRRSRRRSGAPIRRRAGCARNRRSSRDRGSGRRGPCAGAGAPDRRGDEACEEFRRAEVRSFRDFADDFVVFLETYVRIRTNCEPQAPGRGAGGSGEMESLMSGTLAGTGSFRCDECGYVVTLAATDPLPDCPGCGGAAFSRASLFGPGPRFSRQVPAPLAEDDRERWVTQARAVAGEIGEHLAYEDGGRIITVSLTKEWTRVGRSLAADVRFDDPTVSRRHALIVRQPDGVRVLDDRSLNGGFVNDERVEWRPLADGDEMVVGRYRLQSLHLTHEMLTSAAPAGSG